MSQIAFFTRDGDMRVDSPGYRTLISALNALMRGAHPGYFFEPFSPCPHEVAKSVKEAKNKSLMTVPDCRSVTEGQRPRTLGRLNSGLASKMTQC